MKCLPRSPFREGSARDLAWAKKVSRVLLAVAFLLTAGTSRADRRELYTVLGYEGGVSHYLLPEAGSGAATSYAGALDLGVYYGLTNTVHLGARLRASGASDLHFSGAMLRLPDGSASSGEVYEDHRSLGLYALALYRVDTGLSLAPLVELEGGLTAHQYRNIAYVPSGVAYSVGLPDVSQTVLHVSGAVLLEYRFSNRYVVATGIRVQAEGGQNPWAVVVPLRVGRNLVGRSRGRTVLREPANSRGRLASPFGPSRRLASLDHHRDLARCAANSELPLNPVSEAVSSSRVADAPGSERPRGAIRWSYRPRVARGHRGAGSFAIGKPQVPAMQAIARACSKEISSALRTRFSKARLSLGTPP